MGDSIWYYHTMRRYQVSSLKNGQENRISVKNEKEDESPPSSFSNLS